MQQNTSRRPDSKQDTEDRLSTTWFIIVLAILAFCALVLLQLFIRGNNGLYLQ